MARPRRRLVLFLLLAIGAAAALVRLPVWSSQLIARRLAATFQRPAHVGAVRYRLFPPRVEVQEIRVEGARPEDPPLLEIPRVVAVPRVRPLWERRAVLARLELFRPRLRLQIGKDGELPALQGGDASEVRIDRLVISGGEIVVNDHRTPLDLDLPGFEGTLTGDSTRTLRGRMAFGPGSLRLGEREVLSIGSEVDLALLGTRLEILRGRAQAPRTDLVYRGYLELAPRPEGQFTVAGPVDLQVVDRHLAGSGFGLRGAARYDGTVTVDGSAIRLSGRVEGTEGRFDEVEVPRYAGQVSWDAGGLRLRGLELVALGGTSRLDVDVPPGRGTARLEGTFEGLDAEGLSRLVFDVGSAGLGASATGRATLSWPRGHSRDLSGTLAADLVAGSDGRTPLSGRLEWSARNGEQVIDAADLRTPSTQVRLHGRIGRDQHVDLDVDGESRDLADSDNLFGRLRRALGASAAPSGLSGAGLFRGRWRGTLDTPVFEGRFTGQEVGYLGVVWGRAEWAGTVTSTDVQSHSLVLRRSGSEMWLDGRSETGDAGGADGLDLRVRLTDWPAEDLLRAMEWTAEVSGPVSGEVTVSGRRSDPHGSAHLALGHGLYYGVPFSALELDALLEGPVTHVTGGRARIGGGRLSFQGSVTAEGVYDASAEANDVELADVLTGLAPEHRLGGRVSGRTEFQGTLDKPRLVGSLRSARLFLGDEGLGALEAEWSGDGAGDIVVSGRCRSPRLSLELSGTVAAASPYRSDLKLSAQKTSVDPFLRAALPSLPSSVAIVASGEAHLVGPLRTPRAMAGEGEISELELLLPEYPVKNRGPMKVALHEGRLELREVHLSGEGTDLAVVGAAGLVSDGSLDLTLRGAADLRALPLVLRDLRGQGATNVAMHISGTRSAPQLDGTLEIDAGVLRARGFPHGLEEVRGQVRFTEGAAQLTDFQATLAGRPVELTGQATYGRGRPLAFDVHGTGQGLTFRYPEGLKSVVDADLRFYGDLTRQWLTGSVAVREALYDRRYDVAAELLAESRPRTEPPSLKEGLRYDLKISAPGTLRIDNNLATLQARAELSLQGTYEAPVILGHAELERGRVYYQGNTYVIRRGSLDFTNPHKTDPLFDVEAETRVRSYRVTLKVNGTFDRVYPNLSADPPLTTPQILALLAGVEDPSSLTQVDSQRLAYAGAATLPAGRLSEQLGKGAAHLGLNRFSIDPALARDTTNPTARLTFGRRLTPDLSILVSTDLRSTEERLVSVEYTLSDRVSLLMTRDEVGGLGFDLRFRQTR